MYTTIKGGTKEQRELVIKIADFLGNELIGKRLANNIHIDFIIKRNLDADGWCEWMDDPARPREFKLELRKEMTIAQLIVTVCHEMVHVKQMARGELREVGLFSGNPDKQFHVWHGQRMAKEIDYADCPWEDEAYEKQFDLAKKFVLETGYLYEK